MSDALPYGWWTQPEAADELLRLFGKHLVGLELVYEDQKGNHQRVIISGFLVADDSRVLWCTAAHCVEDVIWPVRAVPGAQARWMDAGSPHKAPTVVQRLEFRLAPDGIDLAYTALPPHDAAILLADPKVEAMPLNAVAPSTACTGYCIVGIPSDMSEHTIVDRGEHLIISAKDHIAIFVSELALAHDDNASVPTGFWDERYRYGRISLDDLMTGIETMSSIVGMSGGPVFGFVEREEGTAYCVCGIQSSWLAPDRITKVVDGEHLRTLLQA